MESVNFENGIIGGHVFTKAEQTLKILSINGEDCPYETAR